MKKLLLLLLGVLFALPAMAYDQFFYSHQGQYLFYRTTSDSTVAVVPVPYGYQLTIEGDYVVPEKVEFEGKEYTVTSITSAFYGKEALTSIVIPNSVTDIYQSAFEDCSGLTSVIIGDSSSSADIKIGPKAFYNCSKLTTTYVGNSVTSIGKDAFYRCSGLTKAEFASVEALCRIKFENESSNPLGYAGNLWINGEEIKDLNIPETVDTIGDYAFEYCSGLTSLTIPNSVKSIGYEAFSFCSGLTSVTIPNSVTTIGRYAFWGCSGLTSVTIPNSVTTIGDYAFWDCSGIKFAIIGKSVTSVGSGVFRDCSQLVKGAYPSTIRNPFVVSSNVGSISYNPEGAIFEDDHIYGSEKKSILFVPLNVQGDYVIPESTESIGEYAFWGCSGLTSVTLPNSLASIGNNAFYGCQGLTKATFASVEAMCKIKYEGYYSNPLVYTHDIWIDGKEVKELVIPAAVTSIGRVAFWGCSGLTSVTIPNSVTTIGDYAFRDCSGLTSVTVQAITPPVLGNSIWSDTVLKNAWLNIPQESCDAYLATNWNNFENIKTGDVEIQYYNDDVYRYRTINLPDNPIAVVVKGDYASLTDVVVPERFTDLRDPSNPIRYYVTGIAQNAFSNLTNLKTVSFNNRSIVNTIGIDAFRGCTSLVSVAIPGTVTSIGNNAFYGCNGLTKATFASVEAMCKIKYGNASSNPLSIVHNLWIEGKEVKEIVIPSSVTSIGDYAFYGGSGLTSVSIPGSVTSIGNSAFCNCSGLTSVSIPASVTSIGNGTFSGCSGLTSVSIPGSVTSIGNGTFFSCSGLTSVSIPGSVTSIGDRAFYGCNGLTSVTIPGKVTSIGEEAFYGCSGLTKAEFASVEAMCKIIYGNNSSNPLTYAHNLWIDGKEVKDLTIPNSVTSIGNSAFYYCSGLTSVTIPNSVDSIGDDAFRYCSLDECIIEDGSTELNFGKNSFGSCTLYLGRDFTYAESSGSPFDYTKKLTIGNCVTSIRNYDFCRSDGTTYLTDLTIADGTNELSVEENALSLVNLDSLYLGRNLPVPMLKQSTKLKKLSIGNNITSIESSVFKDFKELTSLYLGSGLNTIETQAFSGCSALAEVILPPSLETIGASAFAGCTSMNSIIMGHKVKTIGEKAFDGCPATTVSITAQTPPTAPNNTFSNYTGKLWLQGQAAVNAFYDAYTCWDRFNSFVMVEPSEMQTSGPKEFTGKAGDQIQLQAKLWPEDVTLPQVFWRATNPDIATVDTNGLVTLQVDLEDIMTMAVGDDNGHCQIIAESLYANGPSMTFDIFNTSEVDDIVIDRENNAGEIDYNEPFDVYNIQGVYMGQSLENVRAGFYIVRQGNVVKKIAVK